MILFVGLRASLSHGDRFKGLVVATSDAKAAYDRTQVRHRSPRICKTWAPFPYFCNHVHLNDCHGFDELFSEEEGPTKGSAFLLEVQIGENASVQFSNRGTSPVRPRLSAMVGLPSAATGVGWAHERHMGSPVRSKRSNAHTPAF